MNNNLECFKSPIRPGIPTTSKLITLQDINSGLLQKKSINIDTQKVIWQKELITLGWPLHAFDYPVHIISNIWLSGVGFDNDIVKWCNHNNFTHIVNAAGSYGRLQFYKSNPISCNIKYLELEISDENKCELYPHINIMYDFVKTAVEDKFNNNKILIHCIWGQSRSVSCIIYFMMKYWQLKYEHALELVQKIRPAANPNNGFSSQLKTMNQ